VPHGPSPSVPSPKLRPELLALREAASRPDGTLSRSLGCAARPPIRHEPAMTLDELRHAELGKLGDLYASDQPVALPHGCYRGVYLRSLETPDARELANRLMVLVAFRALPFGIDFDARSWWFGRPAARIGRFVAIPGISRWRAATVLQLHYHVARLPTFVRQHLYDELKPLEPGLWLGLGGLNRPSGQGALFYFALVAQ
jgi:hypothetical protein